MRSLFGTLLATMALGCNGAASVVPTHPMPVYGAGSAELEAQWAARRERVTARLADVERQVSDTFIAEQMPALSVALLVDGRMVWWRGYGTRDMDAGDAVDQHTVFRIGSVTKPITGMALLRLRDEGRLSLDAPAASFVAELGRVVPPAADCPPITLRHLVTHTSGLPRLGGYDYASNRSSPVSEREMLAGLDGMALIHAPGTKNVYSNFGFGLLGVIVGRVAERPYRDYVSEHILTPLGMLSSVWDAESVPEGRLATGYAWDEKGRAYRRSHHWLMGASEGMGGLYASLDDMVRYTLFNMSAWPPGARPDAPPLRNASLRESHMLGGFQEPGQQGTGFGWGVVQLGKVGHTVFHTGATAQYAATVMFVPGERVGFVALTNSGKLAGAVDRLGGRVLTSLVKVLRQAPVTSRYERGPAVAGDTRPLGPEGA